MNVSVNLFEHHDIIEGPSSAAWSLGFANRLAGLPGTRLLFGFVTRGDKLQKNEWSIEITALGTIPVLHTVFAFAGIVRHADVEKIRLERVSVFGWYDVLERRGWLTMARDQVFSLPILRYDEDLRSSEYYRRMGYSPQRTRTGNPA